MPFRADVDSQYESDGRLRRADVKSLRDWTKKQPHLPEIDELQVILFLHSCYFSNEAAKKCIENYYATRTACPEFFANRNPMCSDVQSAMKATIMTPLPKRTPEDYAIIYQHLQEQNPGAYSVISLIQLFDMVFSFYQQSTGTTQGLILIVNLKGITISHVKNLGITSILAVKKYMLFLQEALPTRLKGLHFVNAVPFMDSILALLRPFMKKELLELLNVHQTDSRTLFDFVPEECLPEDVGGSCGPAKAIHEDFMRLLEENGDYFLEEEKLLVDESKRIGKAKSNFGLEGTFKKLEID